MKLIFEKGKKGRVGCGVPQVQVDAPAGETLLPEGCVRAVDASLPEVGEMEVIRHYTQLSNRNFGVDSNFYPLGSCTMKYNPRLNEEVCRYPGFIGLHPLSDTTHAQGTLEVLYSMERYLSSITGMERFTLQPAAGAHGELVGIMLIKAYHEAQGNPRKRILIPDSAHGTNPASAALCGYAVQTVPSDAHGEVDLEKLKEMVDDDVAAIMLTNPNTLGLFERNILEIAEIMHKHNALLYYDGANMNAVMGTCRPGDMGFDVVHLNLHKTFSTPHGGGGPGSGPVGVSKRLIPYLPVPIIEKDSDGIYVLKHDYPESIGRTIGFYGNVGVIIRAFTYILRLGKEGIAEVGEHAVLNANYLMHALKKHYALPYNRTCMHEFVLSGQKQVEKGVHTINIAKRIIDYGIHPPTIYFPMIVKEALMIEPTETETQETLDEFIEVMIAIAEEVERDPNIVLTAPHSTPVGRLDEVKAAKQTDFCYKECMQACEDR